MVVLEWRGMLVEVVDGMMHDLTPCCEVVTDPRDF